MWILRVISSSGQLIALGEGQFGKQFRDIRTDQGGTQDLAVFGIRDDLGKPGVIAQTQGFTIGLEVETPDLHVVALLPGLRFRKAKGCDLRLAEGGTRDHIDIQFDCFDAGDIFRADHAHGGSYVREEQLTGNIAHRPDAGDAGGHLLIHLDEFAVS